MSGVLGSLFGQGGAGGGFSFGSFFQQIMGLMNPIQMLNTLLYSTQLGLMITNISATVGNAVATAMTTLNTISSYVPYIGWIIAAITAIYRIVANQQERPNVKIGAQFEGVAFNPDTRMFEAGAITAGSYDRVGISRSQATGISNELQQRLTLLANQWVGILNLFPDFLKEQIIPALDQTNQGLNENFKRLKFSPGGSRTIQQELQDISGMGGQGRFVQAFLPALAAGWTAGLKRAQIPMDQTILPQGFGSVFNQEGMNYLIEQIKNVVTTISGLASVSPGGVAQFLTPGNQEYLSAIFNQLFSTSDPKLFSDLAAKLQENLKPVTDFLTQAVKQSTDIFGRGLMAAMEAATDSDARLAFMNSLGTGIKDVVFQGLTEAFIASAQFNDLLAPIQKQIAAFVEQSIATGQPPDIAEFRRIILPNIEGITTRADLLKDIIGALQSLGFEIRDKLGLIPAPTAPTPPPVTQVVTINVTGAGDPETIARKIVDITRGQLPPP
jgi:hypothetical protein